MSFDIFTDVLIQEHIEKPKKVVSTNVREKSKAGHNQINYLVVSKDGQHKYSLFVRENTKPGMEDAFSCGLSLIIPGGESLVLCRYNGSSHFHPNHIEGDTLNFVCHIHKATERYIKYGKKPEGYAVESNSYKTIKGALYCLCRDYNISGLPTTPDNMTEQTLF